MQLPHLLIGLLLASRTNRFQIPDCCEMGEQEAAAAHLQPDPLLDSILRSLAKLHEHGNRFWCTNPNCR